MSGYTKYTVREADRAVFDFLIAESNKEQNPKCLKAIYDSLRTLDLTVIGYDLVLKHLMARSKQLTHDNGLGVVYRYIGKFTGLRAMLIDA